MFSFLWTKRRYAAVGAAWGGLVAAGNLYCGSRFYNSPFACMQNPTNTGALVTQQCQGPAVPLRVYGPWSVAKGLAYGLSWPASAPLSVVGWLAADSSRGVEVRREPTLTVSRCLTSASSPSPSCASTDCAARLLRGWAQPKQNPGEQQQQQQQQHQQPWTFVLDRRAYRAFRTFTPGALFFDSWDKMYTVQ